MAGLVVLSGSQEVHTIIGKNLGSFTSSPMLLSITFSSTLLGTSLASKVCGSDRI